MNLDIIKEVENRVAGGYGKVAAKEPLFNKWKRVVATFLVNEQAAYNNAATVKSLLKLSKEVSDNPRFSSWINTVRNDFGLRHAPLIAYTGALLKYGQKPKDVTIWRTPKDVVDNAAFLFTLKGNFTKKFKKDISKVVTNFDEYQMSKYKNYNANGWRLVDVINLTHPKPTEAINKLIKGELKKPETWEHLISNLPQGKTRKDVWEDLIKNNKLGALALLKNLRNMIKDNVDEKLLIDYIYQKDFGLIFPFQIINGYKEIYNYNNKIAKVLISKLYSPNPILGGKTLIILDVSGSMGSFNLMAHYTDNMASKALGVFFSIVNNTIDKDIVLTAGSDSEGKHKSMFINEKLVKKPLNFSKLINNDVRNKIGYGGIFTKQCLKWVEDEKGKSVYDRIVIISDSQDCDRYDRGDKLPTSLLKKGGKIYVNNIAAYSNVGYTSLNDGVQIEIPTFSSKVADLIRFEEEFKE